MLAICRDVTYRNTFWPLESSVTNRRHTIGNASEWKYIFSLNCLHFGSTNSALLSFNQDCALQKWRKQWIHFESFCSTSLKLFGQNETAIRHPGNKLLLSNLFDVQEFQNLLLTNHSSGCKLAYLCLSSILSWKHWQENKDIRHYINHKT